MPVPDPAVSGPAPCPRCGRALEPEQKFCDGCGLELVVAPDAPMPLVLLEAALPAPPKRKRPRRPPPAPAPVAGPPARLLPEAARPAEAPAAPEEPPAPPKRKRTRKTPAAEDAPAPEAPPAPPAPWPAEAPPAPPAPPKPRRSRTRKAAAPQAAPEVAPEPGTQVLPDVPPPAPAAAEAPPAVAVTRHLEVAPLAEVAAPLAEVAAPLAEVAAPVAPVPAPAPPAPLAPPKPRRPRRSRRAAGTAPAPAPGPAAPHILPHSARRSLLGGDQTALAVIVLLGVLAVGVLSAAGQHLFGPANGPTPTPASQEAPATPPRFQVVPPTPAAPRRLTPTPDGAVANLDIVASTSYRDRAGTLCLVGIIGNDLDVGLGAEVTATLVDTAGATLAQAQSRYYPGGLLVPGVRLPFRMELAAPPPAWSAIQWSLSAFDISGEAEIVYHSLEAQDLVLRPPAGPTAPWTLTGQIANTGARAARSVRLYAAVYDAAGALLDTNEVDGPPDPVVPGARTAFTLPLPRPGMQPARAEVVVEGH